MKTLTIVILIVLLFSNIFAQETNSKKDNDAKVDKSSIKKDINSPQASGDVIQFNNETSNPIITITDEGSNVGSIILPPGAVPSATDNKLYNVGGTLNFNGTALGSGSASAINELSDAKYDGISLFVGEGSGIADDGANYNMAIGKYALHSNTTGLSNTANGYLALYSNTTGSHNTANGYSALNTNTTGYFNTANGMRALYSNTIGSYNTANGYQSLYYNTAGSQNTAYGTEALYSNTTGGQNTANGYQAFHSNTTGYYNTANGYQALYSNTTGYYNTANGMQALYSNTIGSYNTAVGHLAGPNSSDLSNTTALGHGATTTADNQVRIGNSSVTSIGGQVGWTTLSDGRYKRNVREDVAGMAFIMGLRPVTYNLEVELLANKLQENMRIDGDGNRIQEAATLEIASARAKKASVRNTGFIAQEVEALADKLGYEFSGVEVPENEESLYSLRYSEFVVPLVKAVQEQQIMIENLKKQKEEEKIKNTELEERLSKIEKLLEGNRFTKISD